MKKIGLIGGMSWVSTIDYYRFINEIVVARLGGSFSAEIILHSLNFATIEKHQQQGNWDILGEMLAAVAQKLERAGADCVLICANTMHLVAPAVEAQINIPLIHIGDATAAAVQEKGLQRVALLGTRYTMEEPFLRQRLETHGLRIDVPNAEDRTVAHDIVYTELVKGVFREESRAAYLDIINKSNSAGAQGILLACTELPLLIKAEHTAIPLFDTAYLHAKAAVDFALNE